MSVRIRLKKFGTKRRPYYRIVVTDSRTPRDGKPIEEVGFYHPIEVEEKQLKVDLAKIQDWLKKGAQASETVKRLLKRKNIAKNENQT